MAHLIIVEDNTNLASLIVAAARARGHDAVAFGTAHSAIQALGGQAFDGAVVDLLLPDTRGTDVLDALRARHVPAIAVSGVYKGERFARETVEQHGAAQFFQKPFDIRVLLMALEQAIEAAGGQLPDVEIVEEEDSEPGRAPALEVEELEELAPLEEDEGDEPLVPYGQRLTPPPAGAGLLEVPEFVAAAPMLSASVGAKESPERKVPVPELEEEPTTPTRMLGRVELDSLLRSSTAQTGSGLLAVASDGSETDADADAPTKVVHPSAAQLPPAEPPGPAGSSMETSPPATATLADVEAAFTATEIAPEIAPPPAEPPPSTSASRRAVLPFAERDGVWHQPGPDDPRQALPGWDEAGDVSRGLVPRLLNAFYLARHSGELKLKQDSVVKVIQIESGRPIYAASNLASERFGRFCVQHGALAETDLASVSELCQAQKLRTCEAMLRLGLLTPAKHAQLVEEQVREIVWSTFGWSRGRFEVASGRASRPGLVKLQIHPASLILDGVLRASTLVGLRQELRAELRLFPSKDPPYAPHEIGLGLPRMSLLSAADGSKTVEDLLTLSDLSERETLAALAGFQLLGLLEERRDEGRRQRISFGL